MVFGDYICNRHEKCIQISTNMSGTDLEICEISRILEPHDFVWVVKLWPCAKYINNINNLMFTEDCKR